MATSTARKTASTRKPVAARKPASAGTTAVARKAAPAPQTQAASERTSAAPAAGSSSTAEPRKPKLVRHSVTMPKLEYRVIDILKTRAARLGRPSKKSEIVRAGIKALEAMGDADFLACISSLPASKPAKAGAKT